MQCDPYAPAPSPMTKPSRPASQGRDARCGSSFRWLSALWCGGQGERGWEMCQGVNECPVLWGRLLLLVLPQHPAHRHPPPSAPPKHQSSQASYCHAARVTGDDELWGR